MEKQKISNRPIIKNKVLVTGGTGFVGKKLIERLVFEGYSVRVLARKFSNIEPLKRSKVEIVFGDIGDKISVNDALREVDIVVHAAAGTSGGKKDCEVSTILGTRNVLESCKANGICKLIYISSCSVYGVSDYKRNQIVTEESGIERFPWLRGHYSAAKQQAEALVNKAMKHKDFAIVALRPGVIYGPGGDIFLPMIGIRVLHKFFIVLGGRKFILPLAYVDNVVDAILQSIISGNADNQFLNLVDKELVTKEIYIKKIINEIYPKIRVIYLPYFLIHFLTWIQEKAFRVLRKTPFLTTYRLISSQRQVFYDTSKIEKTIGWKPRLNFDEAVKEIIYYRLKVSRGCTPNI